jgi:DUF4097 and DUF4098 domain-containing protein YvlB
MRAQRDAMRAQRDLYRYQTRGLRRTSILGPILLIAVGIVFLLIQSGRLPHQRFWEWYAHWWPLLLVAAGVVLLAEWAFDQFYPHDPSQPHYRRSLGGGVFTLLLVFGITGVVASNIGYLPPGHSKLFPGFTFDQDNLDEFLGDKHESDQTLDLAFPANGALTVVNPRGDVTISGTSDDSRIHIAVHKQVYTRTDSEADTKAQQLTPAVTTSGSSVSLTMPSLEGARSDLVITVPAAAATSVTANRGDIHIASIKAAVTATANHGDIELSAITGPATAHINSHSASVSAHSLANGITIEGPHAQDVTLADITGPVSIDGDFYGTTHLERIAGTIHFHTSRTDFQLARLDGELEVSGSDLSADQALGPVVLTTSHDNVTLNRIAGDISVTNHNGAIDLTAAPSAGSPALGNITLEDRNGSIEATMPDHTGFTVQANTTNGNIDTELPLTTQGSENHKSLSGAILSGGPLLHITTTNGDISIHKAAVAPLPPTPPAPPKLTLAPPHSPAAKRRSE